MNSTLRTGLLVLHALSTCEGPVGVAELARSLDKEKSNVHRVLATLCSHGLVSQDRATRKYRLGKDWTRTFPSTPSSPSSRNTSGNPAAWWTANP